MNPFFHLNSIISLLSRLNVILIKYELFDLKSDIFLQCYALLLYAILNVHRYDANSNDIPTRDEYFQTRAPELLVQHEILLLGQSFCWSPFSNHLSFDICTHCLLYDLAASRYCSAEQLCLDVYSHVFSGSKSWIGNWMCLRCTISCLSWTYIHYSHSAVFRYNILVNFCQ